MIKRFLFPRRTALKDWRQAAAEYRAAKAANDDRRKGRAWEALKRATNEKLRTGT